MRSSVFWKALLPQVGFIVIAAAVVGNPFFSVTIRMIASIVLLTLVAVHGIWLSRMFSQIVSSVAATIDKAKRPSSAGRVVDLPPGLQPVAEAVRRLEESHFHRTTELIEQQSEHAETIELLQTVLETMEDGVIVVDRKQTIVFANPASHALLDIQSMEVVGRPLWEAARLQPLETLISHVLQSGDSKRAEFETHRTHRIIATTARLLAGDPPTRVVLVIHDLTDLRRLERMRRDFVSNVSHELKTPLTSIQAFADTLIDSDQSDPQEQRYFLQKIIEQTERLSALISDILRLGKVESEPDAYNVQAVAISEIVDACLQAHAPLAESRQIRIGVDGIAPGMHVLADSDSVRTILDNLVNNALHYTPAGGSVTVRTTSPPDGDHGKEGLIGIAVTDTGIGIPRDQQERVFERFYRVDRARDRRRGGTGLGLAIVKHLSQLFGGQVELKSELGVGTTFTVWLPIATRDEQQSADEFQTMKSK